MAEVIKKTADSAGKNVSAPPKKGGVIQFAREVQRETSKVTWPTWKETWLTTVMVFIMVALLMMFFFMVDWTLSFGERWLIGALH
ncbi:MAG TPA: preprotein translocase subunit SecE [Rhizomicrobium sp.]|nr:preprotein translocase subunit SecE [Rhizomicrobium sp.]